jgi:hypothetical protein
LPREEGGWGGEIGHGRIVPGLSAASKRFLSRDASFAFDCELRNQNFAR